MDTSPLVRILARSILINPCNLPYYVCFWATPSPLPVRTSFMYGPLCNTHFYGPLNWPPPPPLPCSQSQMRLNPMTALFSEIISSGSSFGRVSHCDGGSKSGAQFQDIIQSPSEARGLGNENGRSRSNSVSAAQGFWRRGRRRGRGPRGERGAEGLDRGSAAA